MDGDTGIWTFPYWCIMTKKLSVGSVRHATADVVKFLERAYASLKSISWTLHHTTPLAPWRVHCRAVFSVVLMQMELMLSILDEINYSALLDAESEYNPLVPPAPGTDS